MVGTKSRGYSNSGRLSEGGVGGGGGGGGVGGGGSTRCCFSAPVTALQICVSGIS